MAGADAENRALNLDHWSQKSWADSCYWVGFLATAATRRDVVLNGVARPDTNAEVGGSALATASIYGAAFSGGPHGELESLQRDPHAWSSTSKKGDDFRHGEVKPQTSCTAIRETN